MNTTELIKHWTMDGAAPDVGERFRSMAGVLAVTEPAERPAGTPEAPRMRRSDEEEWRPLLTAAGNE